MFGDTFHGIFLKTKCNINENCNKLQEVKENRSCSRLRILNHERTILCVSGGQISPYLYVSERMHFYEDM